LVREKLLHLQSTKAIVQAAKALKAARYKDAKIL
jgi:hypothetical protein